MTRAFRIGVWLVAIGYSLWFVSGLLSRVLPPMAHHAEMYAQYGSQWSVTLVYALTLVEVMIAIWPLARGERWAQFAAGLPIVVVGIPRLFDDPRCFASIFSEHGCHLFVVTQVLIFVGLLLTARWDRVFSRNR